MRTFTMYPYWHGLDWPGVVVHVRDKQLYSVFGQYHSQLHAGCPIWAQYAMIWWFLLLLAGQQPFSPSGGGDRPSRKSLFVNYSITFFVEQTFFYYKYLRAVFLLFIHPPSCVTSWWVYVFCLWKQRYSTNYHVNGERLCCVYVVWWVGVDYLRLHSWRCEG